jgi:FdhD protein
MSEVTPTPATSLPQQALDAGVADVEVFRYHDGRVSHEPDLLSVEEPLEIQVRPKHEHEYRSLSVTMRTPGNDGDLVRGFLFNEGVIRSPHDILRIQSWGPLVGPAQSRNICRIDLECEIPELDRLQRHFYTNSSCGVCGRASMDALRACAAGAIPENGPHVRVSAILRIPELLRQSQGAFDSTGGLHATALFTAEGELRHVCEDVGRHNAMDKMAGRLLAEHALPASESMLLASGRLSFELIQKTVMMGVPLIAAIGAPSSLAVQVARSAGVTIIGFLRNDRFNVYSHEGRVLFNE